MSKNLLMISPNNYEDILEKDTIVHYKNFKKEGNFDKVISLYPLARKNLNIDNEYGVFYQYGWKSRYGYLNRFKITKLFGTIILLFKLAFIFPFVIKRENISIIRATDPYYMGLLAYYYSKLLGIPFVVSIHSDYEKRYILDGAKGSFVILGSRKLARKLEKFVYKRSIKTLPIREYIRQGIVKIFKIDQKKVDLFPHGIDIDLFDKTTYLDIFSMFGIDPNKKIISFAGRFSNENYIYDVIKIAKMLLKLRKDFIFVLAGAGNEFEDIKKQSRELELLGFVKFLGFQPQEIVTNLRKQSHISLCLMAGYSLIEACAASRPAISYDVEWHSELVINNKTGYLIKEGDLTEVVAKIDHLLDNAELADQLGKNAREIACKNHGLENTIKIKQEIYSKVLDEYYKK